MYLVNEISYEYTFGPHYSAVNGYPRIYRTILAQSSVILDEFAFEKNFCCSLDDNYTDTTCNKGKTEQRRLAKVI